MRTNHGVVGLPRSRLDLGISPGPCGVSSPAVHLRLAPGASSSRELSASSRMLRPARCPSCLIEPHDSTDRPKSASHGVLSLIAASTGGVHHSPGSPDPRVMFPPRRFSRPRGFAPPPAFAGLFHPAATSRVCPSGVCPSPRSRTGFPRPIHALVSLDASACGLTRASLCAPAFRALLPAVSAVPTETG